MAKNYFVILLFLLAFLIPNFGISQDYANNVLMQKNDKELTIYPNPATTSDTHIYINSKFNSTKSVEFYNVLGKLLFSTVINGKELDISALNKGVYVIKITEQDTRHIRKLVIK